MSSTLNVHQGDAHIALDAQEDNTILCHVCDPLFGDFECSISLQNIIQLAVHIHRQALLQEKCDVLEPVLEHDKSRGIKLYLVIGAKYIDQRNQIETNDEYLVKSQDGTPSVEDVAQILHIDAADIVEILDWSEEDTASLIHDYDMDDYADWPVLHGQKNID